jgi:thioredoxin-like negative regulator of GroEL
MRLFLRGPAVLIAAAVLFPAAASAQVSWETNFDRASDAARKANRPLLLEFWSATCEPCKVLDQNVFPDERIGTAIQKLHPVRVDVDKQPEVARKYSVNGTPTLMVTDSYGTELFRYTGLLDADRMLQLFKELPTDVSRFNQLSLALARDSNDFRVLSALGRELRTEGFFRSSNRYLDRALRTRGTADQNDGRADILVAMGRNYFELREYERSARAFERHLREFPGRPAEPEVMLGLGWALLSQNKTAEGRKVLQSLTEKHKDSRAAADALKLLRQP